MTKLYTITINSCLWRSNLYVFWYSLVWDVLRLAGLQAEPCRTNKKNSESIQHGPGCLQDMVCIVWYLQLFIPGFIPFICFEKVTTDMYNMKQLEESQPGQAACPVNDVHNARHINHIPSRLEISFRSHGSWADGLNQMIQSTSWRSSTLAKYHWRNMYLGNLGKVMKCDWSNSATSCQREASEAKQEGAPEKTSLTAKANTRGKNDFHASKNHPEVLQCFLDRAHMPLLRFAHHACQMLLLASVTSIHVKIQILKDVKMTGVCMSKDETHDVTWLKGLASACHFKSAYSLPHYHPPRNLNSHHIPTHVLKPNQKSHMSQCHKVRPVWAKLSE